MPASRQPSRVVKTLAMTKLGKGKASALRFLLDVIRPTPTLGKRPREDDSDHHDGGTTGLATYTHNATPAPCRQPACIALQNEDADEDAIVITALNTVPFCCHADLITMTRPELLRVGSTLNAKLPLAMQIDISVSRTDAFIRNSIELLVGIRDAMPPAPKHRRTRSVYETPEVVPPSPASPLAGRARSHAVLGTPALAILREESETSRGSVDRPQKRRRIVAPPPTPTEDLRRPITRAQSHRVAPIIASASTESPTAVARVLRTRSQRLPERTPLYEGIHANVTVTRGRSARGRSGIMAKRASFAMTSTPKKRALASLNSPESATPRYRPLLADVGNAVAVAARGPRPVEIPVESADVEDVTFGLEGLTMPMVDGNCSDMDISTGSEARST
ncbi:hypothetical protein C8Q79DRAFT_125576 [Trametes meyenii]|nr:hypothetical protein C8Q79DRAFT_125576 [Trametes meyenii]